MKITGASKNVDRVAFIAICGFFYIATYFSQGNYFDSLFESLFEQGQKREVSTIAELNNTPESLSEGSRARVP